MKTLQLFPLVNWATFFMFVRRECSRKVALESRAAVVGECTNKSDEESFSSLLLIIWVIWGFSKRSDGEFSPRERKWRIFYLSLHSMGRRRQENIQLGLLTLNDRIKAPQKWNPCQSHNHVTNCYTTNTLSNPCFRVGLRYESLTSAMRCATGMSKSNRNHLILKALHPFSTCFAGKCEREKKLSMKNWLWLRTWRL